MNLLVDIGNSYIKWLLHETAGPGNNTMQAMPYEQSGLRELLNKYWQDLDRPDRILICNVGGAQIAKHVDDWISAIWGIKAEYIKTTAIFNELRNAYSDYHTLGTDRWLAIIASWHKFSCRGKALCIVDCGTAMTIDGITKTGQHLGGLILPGYAMMCDAVTANTAIDKIKAIRPVDDLADTTSQAVGNGCLLATVAIIERVVTSMKEKHHEGLICIITGGHARLIKQQLKIEFEYEPDLVLSGLAIVSGTIT